MNKRTTITIFEKTKKRLETFGKMNESFDKLLNRLMDKLEVKKK